MAPQIAFAAKSWLLKILDNQILFFKRHALRKVSGATLKQA
jgi:hypothetical protein